MDMYILGLGGLLWLAFNATFN